MVEAQRNSPADRERRRGRVGAASDPADKGRIQELGLSAGLTISFIAAKFNSLAPSRSHATAPSVFTHPFLSSLRDLARLLDGYGRDDTRLIFRPLISLIHSAPGAFLSAEPDDSHPSPPPSASHTIMGIIRQRGTIFTLGHL